MQNKLQARCVNVYTFTKIIRINALITSWFFLKERKGIHSMSDEGNKSKRFIFRLSEKDNLLFEKNFIVSGENSKAEYIRKLITKYKVSSRLDVIHMNELRRLAGLLGKNTGLLKLHISSLDEVSRQRIDMIIKDNEKLKKEIKNLILEIKKDIGII